MNDNVTNMQAQMDNLQGDAAQAATTPPNEDKALLAGKFSDRDKLEKSTLELFKKVEGKEPSASELLALKSMSDNALEDFYSSVQSDFTRQRQLESEEESSETDELKNAIRELGFVSRDDMERQKYEEEQVRLYLAQDPTAQSRVDLINKLKDLPDFKSKSIAEIDAYIKETAGIRPSVEGNQPTKPNGMGENMGGNPTSPLEMSDEQFMQKYGNGNGDMLSR